MRFATALIGLLTSQLALAHGGGLDRYGCHNDRQAGMYHCHSGNAAGRYFGSKEEMLKGSGTLPSTERTPLPDSTEEPIQASPELSVIEGTVVGVSDGDTLTVLNGHAQLKVRLAEIDTPERRQPYGSQSRKILSEMVFGKAVTVRSDTTDRFGRIVARIYVGKLDVNAELVRLGAAWVYRQYATDNALYQLEEEAREARRGIWSLAESQRIPPWEWRRQARQ